MRLCDDSRAALNSERVIRPHLVIIRQQGQHAAAVAQALGIDLPVRLVGLNRIVATCDLNRLGRFYRFLRLVLEQSATKTLPQGSLSPD